MTKVRPVANLKGYKNLKCESCGLSFSLVGTLKKPINSIHEGHKHFHTFPTTNSITMIFVL